LAWLSVNNPIQTIVADEEPGIEKMGWNRRSGEAFRWIWLFLCLLVENPGQSHFKKSIFNTIELSMAHFLSYKQE
jgi:hypothetical protein